MGSVTTEEEKTDFVRGYCPHPEVAFHTTPGGNVGYCEWCGSESATPRFAGRRLHEVAHEMLNDIAESVLSKKSTSSAARVLDLEKENEELLVKLARANSLVSIIKTAAVSLERDLE
jgi:hypothetical protein